MNVLTVTTLQDELQRLSRILSSCSGVERVFAYSNPYDALNYAASNDINMAFLAIDMPGITGVELSRRLRQINDDIVIIFVADHSEYAISAFRAGAMGYLLMPYTDENVIDEFQRVKRYVRKTDEKRLIKVRTFGCFDLFINNHAVFFTSKKAKEFLAILVDHRGGVVSIEEAIRLLWEDAPYDDKTKANFRKVFMRLRETLRGYAIEDIIVSTRGSACIDVTKIQCDYYSFINNDPKAMEEFNGCYMSNYSWGEPTLASITETYYNRLHIDNGY